MTSAELSALSVSKTRLFLREIIGMSMRLAAYHVQLQWPREISATNAEDKVAISNKTAYQLYQYFPDVCSWKLLNTPCQLGGSGCR